jgi:hypothetical protein
VSVVKNIDLQALRARALISLENEMQPELQGASLFLCLLGSMLLAASPESPWETGCWQSLYDGQAETENVNGPDLLATLANVTQVLS